MPCLLESYRQDIARLNERYQSLSLDSKQHFPSKVSAALLLYQSGSESESIQALELCRAFLNEASSNERQFFFVFDDCLEMFSRSRLVDDVNKLSHAGLLTGDVAQANFDALAGHQDPDGIASALDVLYGGGLLTGDMAQANFDAVARHQKPCSVAKGLGQLHDGGLLIGDAAQANRDALATHQDPPWVASALRLLHNAGLLTGDVAHDNRDAVVGHQSPWLVASALVELHRAGLLTGDAAQANRAAVAGNQNPDRIAQILVKLNGAGLLSGDAAQVNRLAVARHQNPGWIVDAFAVLNDARLLTGAVAQINFSAVARNQHPHAVAFSLIMLNDAGLLTGDVAQINRAAVAGHEDAAPVAAALDLFNAAGLLRGDVAQANFDALIRYSAILLHIAITELWMAIPSDLFTPAQFAALIEICQRHVDNPAAGRDLVITYINRELLGLNDAEAPGLNDGQSTHTASVHQTASESATRLSNSYGIQISRRGPDETIRVISTWLNAQPDLSLEVGAAKRCFERLTAPHYFYTDRRSQMSMKQLLALFWIAIHDDTRRISTLGDAKLRLIEGLYEIQREYNISATGKDNGADRDIPCCASGAFNKIIEKGQGLHPDMVVDFISMAGFSMKLPLVVSEVAMAYLRSSRVRLSLGSLIEAIKAESNAYSVGPIWAEIQGIVADRMFAEFGSLFVNDRASPRFLSAIAAGEFCSLNSGNLSELEQLMGQVLQDGGAAGAGAVRDSFFGAAVNKDKTGGGRPQTPPHP
jgi:hypothetical protein